jgi:hypothetical protein
MLPEMREFHHDVLYRLFRYVPRFATRTTGQQEETRFVLKIVAQHQRTL